MSVRMLLSVIFISYCYDVWSMSKLYESLQDINIYNEKRADIKAKIADVNRQITNYNSYIYHAKMNGDSTRIQYLTYELGDLKTEKEKLNKKLNTVNEKLISAYQCVGNCSKKR